MFMNSLTPLDWSAECFSFIPYTTDPLSSRVFCYFCPLRLELHLLEQI
jgi:hypothetical protein